MTGGTIQEYCDYFWRTPWGGSITLLDYFGFLRHAKDAIEEVKLINVNCNKRVHEEEVNTGAYSSRSGNKTRRVD